MTAAIIIARGGSKRLPRKNVRDFCGHPLIAWTIVQARYSRLIDRVYMSTDDDEIAEISERYGAEIIRRPDWPDADLASGGRPTRHAIGVIKERFGDEFDLLASLMPTVPCRLPGDMDRIITAYHERNVGSLEIQGRPREVLIFEETEPGFSRPVLTSENYGYLTYGGQCHVRTPERYMAESLPEGEDHDEQIHASAGYYGPDWNRPFIEVEAWQGVDCDTLEEFEFAEVVMEHYILKGRGMSVYDAHDGDFSRYADNWKQQ